MPRHPAEQPSDLPPEVAAAIAAMSLDQLRETTFQLLDLAGAHGRKRVAPLPQRRRRRRAKEPFSGDGHRPLPLAAAPGRRGAEAHRRWLAAAHPGDRGHGRAVA